MPNLTVSLPQDLKRDMDELDHINWSAVARKAIEKEVRIQKFHELTKNSTLTEKDAEEIGDAINKSLSKRLRNEAETRRKHSDSSPH